MNNTMIPMKCENGHTFRMNAAAVDDAINASMDESVIQLIKQKQSCCLRCKTPIIHQIENNNECR